MAVVWHNPRAARFATAGLCVPCGGCNAEVGRPCKPGWPCAPTREQIAEALGFVTVNHELVLEASPGRADKERERSPLVPPPPQPRLL